MDVPTTAPALITYFNGTDPTQLNFTSVFEEIVGLIPYVLGLVIGFLAIRKGISFIKNMLGGA